MALIELFRFGWVSTDWETTAIQTSITEVDCTGFKVYDNDRDGMEALSAAGSTRLCEELPWRSEVGNSPSCSPLVWVRLGVVRP